VSDRAAAGCCTTRPARPGRISRRNRQERATAVGPARYDPLDPSETELDVGGRVEQGPRVERANEHRHGVRQALDEGAFVVLAAGVLALAAIVRLMRVFMGPHGH
jgi:hypothetical protein